MEPSLAMSNMHRPNPRCATPARAGVGGTRVPLSLEGAFVHFRVVPILLPTPVPKSAFLRRFYQEVSANFVFDIVYKKPDAERAFAISTYTMTETDRNRGGRGRFADAFLARGLRYARFFVDFSLPVSA